MPRIAAVLAALVLTVNLGSAQSLGSAKSTSTGKAAPRLSDAQLEAAIRARFEQSKISKNHFQVHVRSGVATLEGNTDIIQHKGTATRLAKSAGAIAVNNKIEVSEAARKKASDNLAKGRRRAQIKRGEPRSQSGPPKK